MGDLGGKVLPLGTMIIEEVFKDIALLTRRQNAGEISEAEALQGFRDLILNAFDPKAVKMTDAQIPVYAARRRRSSATVEGANWMTRKNTGSNLGARASSKHNAPRASK